MKETLEFVFNEEKHKLIQELLAQGYCYQCLVCRRVCKTPLKEEVSPGHFINMCSCGSDLFNKLEKISCVQAKVLPPVDGTLVFKQHHAKYCKCDVGESWTGDADTECWTDFELLEKDEEKKVFRCIKSNLKIIILKSTEEELKNPDEAGSRFLRMPGV